MSEKIPVCPASLKRSYSSIQEANQVLDIIKRRKLSGDHYPVAAYKCKEVGCYSWHLTSRKKNRKDKRLR